MFDLGIQELIVIFLVALVVLGPKKLPELGKTLGKVVREMKKALHEFKNEIDPHVVDPYVNSFKEPLNAFKDIKNAVNPVNNLLAKSPVTVNENISETIKPHESSDKDISMHNIDKNQSEKQNTSSV